jgi:mRNA interferase MazF
MVRGEVFRLPDPRGTRGHEQPGARYAVIVQADEFLDLSTVLIAPTSTSARPTSFRPRITLDRQQTRALPSRRPSSTRSASADQPDASTQASSVPSTTPSCLSSACRTPDVTKGPQCEPFVVDPSGS